MTGRERMIAAMFNREADMVPVAPDMSNMIPCRLTGKPFWDIYLYQNPPLWKAYIDAVHFFGIDGWLPDVPVCTEWDIKQAQNAPAWTEAVVHRTQDRIITRLHAVIDGRETWTDYCNVYYIDNPPTHFVTLDIAGLPSCDPDSWEDVVPRSAYSASDALDAARKLMADAGVVGQCVALPGLGLRPESMYEYYDNPSAVHARCEAYHEATVGRLADLLKLRPDFILIGISGFMISNPLPIFRELALPTLQAVTRMCKDAGIPSQIHCCGPEYDLVKISAEESDLSSINPLEIPPMGDCDLAQIKKEFGSKISLMGNLHTTEVMLRGTPQLVAVESKKAIDTAAEGGGFILSTGDQCGRDTPDENILAMVEIARTYGVYR